MPCSPGSTGRASGASPRASRRSRTPTSRSSSAPESHTAPGARVLFGIGVHVVPPLLFVLAVPATIVSVGMLGFLLSVTVVRYRTAWALGNAFEYPVWLVCGFLVPLSLFPGWVRPISWALAPTWGMNAIRESALGGTPWPDVGMCLLLGAAYTLTGVLVLDRVLRAARRRAALSLT